MTFTEILDSFGVRWLTEGNPHCRPGWINLDCPFCGPGSGKFHLGFNIASRYLNCYKCRGHSLLSTLEALTNAPRDKLREMLRGFADDFIEERQSKRGKLKLPKGLGPLFRAHRDYLRERGYDLDELRERWQVQGLGPVGHVKTEEKRINLAWRIFIPFILGGDVVSWTTRSLQPEARVRYITAPESCEVINAKELLYGEDFCRHAVCAVEGPFDAWAGGVGFVSLSGTAFKRAQVRRLSRYSVIGVCFDNESDAQQRARELVNELMPFTENVFNFILDDSKDPSEDMKKGGKEIKRIRRQLGL